VLINFLHSHILVTVQTQYTLIFGDFIFELFLHFIGLVIVWAGIMGINTLIKAYLWISVMVVVAIGYLINDRFLNLMAWQSKRNVWIVVLIWAFLQVILLLVRLVSVILVFYHPMFCLFMLTYYPFSMFDYKSIII
jgi:hypothetical protein